MNRILFFIMICCDQTLKKFELSEQTIKYKLSSVKDIFCQLPWKRLIVALLKVLSDTFLLVCFLSLNESTCETRENVFLYNFKSSFCSREKNILEF